MYCPWQREKALFLAAAAPLFSWVITQTFPQENLRAIARVSSLEPSSTTMISFRGHVCATADRSVSLIHSCALNAGMRIDTRGSITDPAQQFSVCVSSHFTHNIPRMPSDGIIPNLLPPSVQVLEKITLEIHFDGFG